MDGTIRMNSRLAELTDWTRLAETLTNDLETTPKPPEEEMVLEFVECGVLWTIKKKRGEPVRIWARFGERDEPDNFVCLTDESCQLSEEQVRNFKKGIGQLVTALNAALSNLQK